MKDFYKKWEFWAVVAVIILIYGYNKGWFTAKAKVAEPLPPSQFIADEADELSLDNETEHRASTLGGRISSIILNKVRNNTRLTKKELSSLQAVDNNIIEDPNTGNLRFKCCSKDGVNITVTLLSHWFGKGCGKAAGACGDLMGE